MRTRLLIGSILALAFIAGGCSSKVIRYEKGGEAQTMAAPKTGTYSLHKSIRRTGSLFKYRLNEGQRVGFQNRDGSIVAVAGEHEVNLGSRDIVPTYTWRVKK
jgi:hypothetical protein